MSCPDAIGRLIEKVVKLQNGKEEKMFNESITDEELYILKPTANTANDHLCEIIGENDECCCLEKTNQDRTAVLIATISICPECNKELEHEGGCVICRNCGFSKCGIKDGAFSSHLSSMLIRKGKKCRFRLI